MCLLIHDLIHASTTLHAGEQVKIRGDYFLVNASEKDTHGLLLRR